MHDDHFFGRPVRRSDFVDGTDGSLRPLFYWDLRVDAQCVVVDCVHVV